MDSFDMPEVSYQQHLATQQLLHEQTRALRELRERIARLERAICADKISSTAPPEKPFDPMDNYR